MSRAPGDHGPDRWDLGRLDLDNLDAVDLDLLDSDDVRPAWMVRSAALLEGWGVTRFVRRHRRGIAAITILVLVAAGVALASWRNRPAPLAAAPRVIARSAGADPTAVLTLGAGTGEPVAVSQHLVVSVAEPPGVSVTLLRLTGPALRAGGESPVPVDRARTDREVTVSAALDCATPEGTTAAVGARDDSYAIQVQRRGPAGDVRTDDVPLIAATGLADLVRTACLQSALDRDLRVTAVTATPVPGAVAADLVVTVGNGSSREWSGLAIAPSASPQLVTGGASTGLSPGTTGTLRARLLPLDCADPIVSLADGIPVRADLGPSGDAPPDAPDPPALYLALPASALTSIAAAFDSACGHARPTATARSAILREAGDATTAGLLEIDVVVRGLPSTTLDADHPSVASDGGSLGLGGSGSPMPVVDGVARLTLLWQAPSCADVAAHGGLHMQVIATSGVAHPRTLAVSGLHALVIGPSTVSRPYTIAVGGQPLRTTLTRLCGPDVAAVVG